MFMHYKWVKIEIANRRFLATRTFFQIWKSWPRYLGNGAQVLDFTLKKSEVQHPLDFTFFTVGLHFNKKWSPTVKKSEVQHLLDFTFFTVGLHFKFFKKNIGLHRRKCTNREIQNISLGKSEMFSKNPKILPKVKKFLKIRMFSESTTI